MKHATLSAAECEIASDFLNAQEAMPIRNTLIELNHPHPLAPVQVDNTAAIGFMNKQIKQKRSKAMSMHFYWPQHRETQKQFNVLWNTEKEN